MFANATFFLAIIGGPFLVGCAMAYALVRQRRLSAKDRAALMDADDPVYVDEEDDGCPIRIDRERRRKAA